MVHYLGPTVGKVPLRTWEEIAAAASGGQLAESQWVELKKELGPAKTEVNRELARDLAALSVHGGILIFGVEDKTFKVVGCDIAGMEDRIAQVASMSVHPPLSPLIYPPVALPDDESKHVLVVEVPPSPLAPHMADSCYWGRSSNGKRKLADPEVRDLLASRTRSDQAFRERLLAMAEDDPLASSIEGYPTGNGHIFLLAEPCMAVLGRGDFKLQNIVVGLFHGQEQMGSLASATYSIRNPLGEAVASTGIGHQVERLYEDQQAYLLCHDDDSSLHFVSGGGTMYRDRGFYPGDGAGEIVGDSTIVRSTRQFLQLIESLASDHWGYTGQWRIGIHITNLRGKHIRPIESLSDRGVFPADTYTRQSLITPASWQDGGEAEARNLLSGFLRAVGRENEPLHSIARR